MVLVSNPSYFISGSILGLVYIYIYIFVIRFGKQYSVFLSVVVNWFWGIGIAFVRCS